MEDSTLYRGVGPHVNNDYASIPTVYEMIGVQAKPVQAQVQVQVCNKATIRGHH